MDSARTGARAPAGGWPTPTTFDVHGDDHRDASGTPLLRPFPGLRYVPDVAGPLDRLLAPPHTELDKTRRAAFLASSPYVVTHLERPEYGGSTSPLVLDWLNRGVLLQDPASFYVVRQPGVSSGARHFLLGTLTVTRDDPRVHPHEGVFEQAVVARLQRLEATMVDSEPVLVVDSDPWPVPWTDPAPLGHHVLGAGGVDVWRIRDPQVVEALAEASRTHRFLIADGHHRYAAAVLAAHRSGRPQDLLVAVAAESAEPVDLRALHRIVPARAAQSVLDAATRRRRLVGDHSVLARVQASLGADQAVVVQSSGAEVVEGPPADGASGAGAFVDAAIRAGGTPNDLVQYQGDLDVVLDAVGGHAAVLLPHPTVRRLNRLVQAGGLMGRKTTWFRPKPLAGTVLRLR
ncbi:DUF1015 family protein [Kineococcus endophyticus]|uniref:DUF1015 family protein n=1 Tax=Kineococcus endophyticus TaxID=1181883 RepID=A0ABV3PCW1_9ACTN